MICTEDYWIIFGIISFIGCAVGGSLLVYFNYAMVCPPCISGYNVVVVNHVLTCVGSGLDYAQCHPEYNEPGFAIGCVMLSIVWLCFYVAIGSPAIIIL